MAKEIPLTRGFVAIVDDADYDALAQFKWCVIGRGLYAGRAVKFGISQKTVLMHRVITNAPVGLVVDHINGDIYDNRRQNLRVVTQQLNAYNRTKLNCNNTSGYMGVSWSRSLKKWQAMIKRDGIKLGLGYFDDATEAAMAYDRAAKARWADKAAVNFPEVLP